MDQPAAGGGRGLIPGACLSVAAAWVLALAVAPGPVGADQRTREDVQHLIRTWSKQTRDPAEIAARLWEAAGQVTDNPPLKAELCTNCYEYGTRRPDGYPVAVAAAQAMLASAQTTRERAEWATRLIRAQRLRYSRAEGDQKPRVGAELVRSLIAVGERHLAAQRFAEAGRSFGEARLLAKSLKLEFVGLAEWKIKLTEASGRVHRAIQLCRARLEKDPADVQAAEMLLRLHVTELDKPAEAKPFLRAESDESYRTLLPLAVRDAATLNEDDCSRLAAWYGKLATSASALGRPRLLVRQIRYLERFCHVHQAGDVPRLSASADLTQARKELAAFAWFGVRGTVWSAADDRFVLRLNGRIVARNRRNCGSATVPEIVVKPGDLLMARVWDVRAPSRGFSMHFTGDDPRVTFTSGAPWRIAHPKDTNQWWVFEPADSDPPCHVTGKGGRFIWGRHKTSYLYHIVTAADLTPPALTSP